MPKDPWTDPDPQPGDFDAVLAMLDEDMIEAHEGDSSAEVRVLVSVEGDDVARLERVAEARGVSPDAVVAALLREADRSAS